MPPQDKEAYYERYRQAVVRKTERLPGDQEVTSFSPGPPPDLEYSLFHDVLAEMRWKLAHEVFAAKLSGFVDWAGRELTEDDIPELVDRFNIDADAFSVSEYNKHQQRDDLDRWAVGNGVTRAEETRATGTVTAFLRQPGGVVDPGTVFTTNNDLDPVYEYVVQSRRSAGQEETVIRDIPIEARYGGPQYNVGPGSVQDTAEGYGQNIVRVTNPSSIAGGEVEEKQDEFRQRARRAMEYNASGTTEQGVVGEVYREYQDDYGLEPDDIRVVQHHDPDAPDNEFGHIYADVIVNGGPPKDQIEDFLEGFQYPVLHRVLRPTEHRIDITAVLRPNQFSAREDINTTRAENNVIARVNELGIGENMSVNKLGSVIITSDKGDIHDIDDFLVYDDYSGETVAPGEDLNIPNNHLIVLNDVTFSTGPFDG